MVMSFRPMSSPSSGRTTVPLNVWNVGFVPELLLPLSFTAQQMSSLFVPSLMTRHSSESHCPTFSV